MKFSLEFALKDLAKARKATLVSVQEPKLPKESTIIWKGLWHELTERNNDAI